jgi:hypothetical protein
MYVGNAQSKSSILLNNAELVVVVEVKDLDVTVDFRLNSDAHIRQTVAQAFIIANHIHRCFVSRGIFTLFCAFKGYVKPIVEYA